MSREKLSRREAFERLAGLAALPVAVSLVSKSDVAPQSGGDFGQIHRIEPTDSPLASEVSSGNPLHEWHSDVLRPAATWEHERRHMVTAYFKRDTGPQPAFQAMRGAASDQV